MRECGVRGFLICYGDCHRSHPVAVSGDRRLDDVRLSDLGCGSPAGPGGWRRVDVRRVSIGKKRPDVQRFPDDTRRARPNRLDPNQRQGRIEPAGDSWQKCSEASPHRLIVARRVLRSPAVPLGSDARKRALAARAEG